MGVQQSKAPKSLPGLLSINYRLQYCTPKYLQQEHQTVHWCCSEPGNPIHLRRTKVNTNSSLWDPGKYSASWDTQAEGCTWNLWKIKKAWKRPPITNTCRKLETPQSTQTNFSPTQSARAERKASPPRTPPTLRKSAKITTSITFSETAQYQENSPRRIKQEI